MHIRFLLLFCFLSNVVVAQPGFKKVVFIIADGIPADVLERVGTPNIGRITKQGCYMRAIVGGIKGTYTETPTISAVGYNSLLTGTWVNKHNVWGNDIKAPNYNYPNIFKLLKDQYPHKKTGIFSSWTDNRTKLAGDGLPATANLKIDFAYDGYELDTLQYPHDAAGNYMHLIDERVSKEAARTITTNAPDLSWVYLEYTDDVAHKYGDSKQLDSAVQLMDKQVARIWKAIEYRTKKFKEEWLIIITTDHGRDEITGKGHGGQTPRQRNTWIATNYNTVNKYATYYTPAIVDIMPTIARFMKINITGNLLPEVDGTPLIGPVSIANANGLLIPGAIDVTWKALQTNGVVKIKVATTNNFKDGGNDEYKLLATVPINQQHFQINIVNMDADFYKIVLETPANTINTWIEKK